MVFCSLHHHQKRSAVGTCLAAVGLLVFSITTHANPFYNAAYDTKDPSTILQVMPVRLMEDDQLIMSAAQIRDQQMPATQRLLNYHWLQQDAHSTIVGAKALSKLLRFSLHQVWQSQENSTFMSAEKFTTMEWNALLTPFGNYTVKASEKSILLRYHYEVSF